MGIIWFLITLHVVYQIANHYSASSFWDIFRAANPLYALMHVDRMTDFIKKMLRQYDNYGYLLIWQL